MFLNYNFEVGTLLRIILQLTWGLLERMSYSIRITLPLIISQGASSKSRYQKKLFYDIGAVVLKCGCASVTWRAYPNTDSWALFAHRPPLPSLGFSRWSLLNFAVLTNSQVMPIMLVQGPPLITTRTNYGYPLLLALTYVLAKRKYMPPSKVFWAQARVEPLPSCFQTLQSSRDLFVS